MEKASVEVDREGWRPVLVEDASDEAAAPTTERCEVEMASKELISEEVRSTQRQVDRASEYARAKGWTVDPRYVFVDEATSGAEWKHRPGFNALIAALDPKPPFGVLIVSELSRIGRDTVRTPAAVLQIEEAGVAIHGYLSGLPITLGDETGEMMTVLHSLGASFERRRARQRTYDAMRRRAEAGAVTGGTLYGYSNVRRGNGYVHRLVNADQAAVVRRSSRCTRTAPGS